MNGLKKIAMISILLCFSVNGGTIVSSLYRVLGRVSREESAREVIDSFYQNMQILHDISGPEELEIFERLMDREYGTNCARTEDDLRVALNGENVHDDHIVSAFIACRQSMMNLINFGNNHPDLYVVMQEQAGVWEAKRRSRNN